MCYPILGQRKLKANDVDRQFAPGKAQSSSCFDLDSDRVTVLVSRQTEVSISVWGKPLELGNSLPSTNQRPFIYWPPHGCFAPCMPWTFGNMAAEVVSVATPHEYCHAFASGRCLPTSFCVGKELTIDTFSQNFCGLEALDRCQQLLGCQFSFALPCRS